jgi:hypothetical protein
MGSRKQAKQLQQYWNVSHLAKSMFVFVYLPVISPKDGGHLGWAWANLLRGSASYRSNHSLK